MNNSFEKPQTPRNSEKSNHYAAVARFMIGALDGRLILQYIGDRARQDLTRLIDTVIGLTDGIIYSSGDHSHEDIC